MPNRLAAVRCSIAATFGPPSNFIMVGAQKLYGVEAFTRPRTNNYHSLLKYRPDLPAWLDFILSRATQPHAQDRFADVMELAYELEDGLLRGAKSTPPHKLPIMQRNPLRFWQTVSLILAVILFTMLVLDR